MHVWSCMNGVSSSDQRPPSNPISLQQSASTHCHSCWLIVAPWRIHVLGSSVLSQWWTHREDNTYPMERPYANLWASTVTSTRSLGWIWAWSFLLELIPKSLCHEMRRSAEGLKGIHRVVQIFYIFYIDSCRLADAALRKRCTVDRWACGRNYMATVSLSVPWLLDEYAGRRLGFLLVDEEMRLKKERCYVSTRVLPIASYTIKLRTVFRLERTTPLLQLGSIS